jgi:4-amino-4-deoxy-L-arabinose transferase-like glycosyltransferase
MRLRLLRTLSLPVVLFIVYSLGEIPWPPGPLFLLRLILKPFSLLLLFWVGSLGLGDLFLQLLGIRLARGERLLYSAGLGLMIWWLVLLGCGLWGLFQRESAWGLLLGVGLLGVWRFPLLLDGWQWKWPRLTGWSVFLWIVIFVNLLYPLLTYAFLPPLAWDEIAYHLAVPKIYMASGRIVPVPFIFPSYFPFGLEMLYTLALLLGPSGEVLSHLMHWSLSLLTFAGLTYLGSQQKQELGLLAGAVFLSLPVIKELAGTSLIDVGLCAYSWLAFMAWWSWRQKQDWRWLCLAGLLAGGAASVKLSGSSVALLLSGMTLLTPSQMAFRSRLKASALLGTIAFTVVSPWYVKSWIFTGDPIFPFGWGIFPSSEWDAFGARYLYEYLDLFKMPFTLTSYLIGPAKLFFYPKQFDWLHLGYILILLGPLSLVEIRREKLLRWLFLFVVGYYSLWFCFLIHLIRYLLPILPMAAFLAAWGSTWLIARVGSIGKGVVVAFLLLDLAIVQAESRSTLSSRMLYLTGHQSRNELLAGAVKPFPVFDYINRKLPKNARILLATYEVRGYFLDRGYVWAHPIGQRVLRFEQIPNGSSLRQVLAAHGIDYLLDNRLEWDETLTRFKYYGHVTRLLDEMIASYGEKLFSEGGMTVYRLRTSTL